MDPNFFTVNWERLIEVLTMIVILAFFVERALTWLFQIKWYEDYLKPLHIKPFIAFALSYGVCYFWDFDALSIILVKEKMETLGFVVTAGIIAGGSKGALELLRNIRMFQKESKGDSSGTKS